MELVNHFINTVADELNHLNGSEFEALCRPFLEMLTGKEFELKGHSLEMKSVKASVDLIQDEDTKVIGQCGTDSDYFSSDKPEKDIEGSQNNSPDFKTIYLLCNRRAKGKEFQTTKQNIKKKLAQSYKYYLFDSQRMAKSIYANIFKAKEVEEILHYLPKSYEYYQILPQSNVLPLQHENYKDRPEENEIIEKLKSVDCLQIFGLSGIGKTQLSLAVANNLSSQFQTILWFDGEKTDVNNLHNAVIRRMGEEINLAAALERFCTLVIVDNLNDSVGDLFTNFSKYNKKGSKCIVTSLQKNVDNANSYNLTYVSDAITRNILLDADNPPTEAQIEQLLTQISGYPLLLELAKQAVDNEEMTWDDVIQESNITAINDTERNEVFAQRILGRYVERLTLQFNLLMFLDSTIVSKLFLKEVSRLRYNDLKTYSIIQETDEYYCKVHQVVLSAIDSLIGAKYDREIVNGTLLKYLKPHLERRDEGLYTLMACHLQTITQYGSTLPPEDELRHYITLAHLYAVDTYTDSEQYISQINGLKLDAENSNVDLCLIIERLEIEQNVTRKQYGENSEELKKKVEKDIVEVQGLHLKIDAEKALISHHIGKWKSSIGDKKGAEKFLLDSLQLDPHSYHSMLRLAKDYKSLGEFDKVIEYADKILGAKENDNVPLSIRLSTYDLISNNDYRELKKKYIYDQQKEFTEDIYASLSQRYSHTYILLAKYAYDFSYNFPEMFHAICSKLPLPQHIDTDNRIRKDYGTIIVAQCLYCNYTDEYKDRLYVIAEGYLMSVPRDGKDGDYIRKDLIRLHLAMRKPARALPFADEMYDKNNMFIQQILCKVYYENGDYAKALDIIDKAIAQVSPKKPEYGAAFRHDKAKCLHETGDKDAVNVMKEAINLQPNPKTKKEWEEELNNWK